MDMNMDMDIDSTTIENNRQPIITYQNGRMSQLKALFFNQRGFIAVSVAGVLLAIQAILVKVVKDDTPVTEVVFLRFFLQGIFVLMACLWFKGVRSLYPQSKRELIFLILRGLTGTASIGFMYYAIYNVSTGMVVTIMFGSPAFTGLMAFLFLREKLYLVDVVLMVVNITGVVLIARPSFIFPSEDGLDESTTTEVIGISAAVGAMLCLTFSIILMRVLGEMKCNALKIITYYAIVGSISSIILAICIGGWSIPSCGGIRFAFVGIGLTNAISNSLLAYGIAKSLQVYFVPLINSIQVPITIFLEFIFFDILPHWISTIGVVLVLFTVVCVFLRERSDFRKTLQANPRDEEQDDVV